MKIENWKLKITKQGFTLVELLIVITILSILVIVAIMLINPLQQIAKARDSKRKTDLNSLHNSLENWYNDKGSYPKPVEICYENTNPCYICGLESTSPNLDPYLDILPCDPQHPSKKYLYQVNDVNNPRWYRVYTMLENDNDQESKSVGCQYGCGPALETGHSYEYYYGITSPNIDLEIPIIYYGCTGNCGCHHCGTKDDLSNCVSLPKIYGDSICLNKCKPC